MTRSLLHGSVVDHYLYYALNDPQYTRRVKRLRMTLNGAGSGHGQGTVPRAAAE